MPGRLDRVSVRYSRGTVEVPWDSRDALLDEIRANEDARSTVEAFEAVGAWRPVELESDETVLLIASIEGWLRNVGGAEHLPPGIPELCRALIRDLHDTGRDP